MNQSGKIPATIITGFLGSGKTTLIRSLLEKSNGTRIALIINEFGDMGFDGTMLNGCNESACGEDDIIELANGCICCTVADDFLPTIEKLLDRKSGLDHIIIETSGLALPQPLVQAFNWPGIKTRVTVDGVVTVVDAAAVSEGRVAGDLDAIEKQRAEDEQLDHDSGIEELFEDQLVCADLVVMSKTDLIDEAACERVEKRIRMDARKGVSLVRSGVRLPGPEIVLGVAAAAEQDFAGREGHHGADHHEHDHDEFESFIVSLPVQISKKMIEQKLVSALAMPGVLRIKGWVEIEGKAMPLVVQGVGPRLETYFYKVKKDVTYGLVVIGEHDFDQSAISGTLLG
ncbi:MAG: cobalamin biosynthesis protein CobW [Cohaesibacteraceae bacterium]|nr:cobalamin biosynthesis protein CobW [Cohaesibacteraceae bacterium]MBL4875386.1 cobalamin biosynthesis protein CobW [Cohaesibacteraceae bacterium]